LIEFLNKIFVHRKTKASTKVDTLPLKIDDSGVGEEGDTKPLSSFEGEIGGFSREFKTIRMETPQLMASCAQSTGIQRDHNEDALFSLTTVFTGTNGEITPFGVYIVADGMGGHQDGELASLIAVKTMASLIVKDVFSNLISPHPQPPDETLQEIMKRGIYKAHEKVQEEVVGGGTTLSAVTILGKQMTIAHVGDSRVYEIGLNGPIHPLTRDHSLVKRLVELGKLTPDEAAIDPRRSVLYNALGQDPPLEPEIISSPLPQSGFLLICSDGLWGVVAETQIDAIILNNESLPTACQILINAAIEAGGPDNITAILVKLPE
jgi:serine/threonine protein phosphatase PrpC